MKQSIGFGKIQEGDTKRKFWWFSAVLKVAHDCKILVLKVG